MRRGEIWPAKQKVTLRLDPETIRKAKILAARQGTSVSRVLAQYLEQSAGQDDAYQSAHRHARQLLDPGLHLGGRSRATRDQLHERYARITIENPFVPAKRR